MCLKIQKRVKLPKVRKDGYCIGYKVISFDNNSIYQFHEYTIGENLSNREDKSLTSTEKVFDEVEKGFHIFLCLRIAKESVLMTGNAYFRERKMIRVYFRPKDVVATGTWGTSNNVVVTKMLIKSLKHICKK